jgi:hypothetical protein
MAEKPNFENVAKIGECIKAYDLMPTSWLNFYVVGVVQEITVVDDQKVFLIDCVYDSAANQEYSRVGRKVKVPLELSSFDFDYRIQKV